MTTNRGIVQEPCTLVYTLLDPNTINFADFSLVVRSLHSYMVDSIVPNEQLNNVHVKLRYQASLANAQAKLGTLQSAVGVTKLSAHVNETEFSQLEQLRRKFNIGAEIPVFATPPAARRRRGNTSRIFQQRPAPYAAPVPSPLLQRVQQAYYNDNAHSVPTEEISE